MSINRWNRRVDENQREIYDALISEGAQVDIIGLPVDLLVGGMKPNGEYVFGFFEVKDGKKYKSSQSMTKAMTDLQIKFFERWDGYNLFLVNSPKSAVAFYREMIS